MTAWMQAEYEETLEYFRTKLAMAQTHEDKEKYENVITTLESMILSYNTAQTGETK